jgi:hypothetical protein
LLIDDNPEAIKVMRKRFAERADVHFEEPTSQRP